MSTELWNGCFLSHQAEQVNEMKQSVLCLYLQQDVFVSGSSMLRLYDLTAKSTEVVEGLNHLLSAPSSLCHDHNS